VASPHLTVSIDGECVPASADLHPMQAPVFTSMCRHALAEFAGLQETCMRRITPAGTVQTRCLAAVCQAALR